MRISDWSSDVCSSDLGGEAQRVAIGRALLSGPRFMLMDEPLSSLDSSRRAEIMPVIEYIRDELKHPILYVSHDRGEVERLATRSEEHTSELQSLMRISYAVFCLKKKKCILNE